MTEVQINMFLKKSLNTLIKLHEGFQVTLLKLNKNWHLCLRPRNDGKELLWLGCL